MWRGISAAVGVIIAVGAIDKASAADPIEGRASIIDGDTVDIRGVRVRLYGIDAPESAQPCRTAEGGSYRCGQVAALALAEHIGEAPITCDPIELDRYGRTVAVCSKGEEDLGAWMVSQGHALAFRRFSVAYVGEETEARKAARGVWAGAFTEPWAWRREQKAKPLGTAPPAAATEP